jgi:hypothetical protein
LQPRLLSAAPQLVVLNGLASALDRLSARFDLRISRMAFFREAKDNVESSGEIIQIFRKPFFGIRKARLAREGRVEKLAQLGKPRIELGDFRMNKTLETREEGREFGGFLTVKANLSPGSVDDVGQVADKLLLIKHRDKRELNRRNDTDGREKPFLDRSRPVGDRLRSLLRIPSGWE